MAPLKTWPAANGSLNRCVIIQLFSFNFWNKNMFIKYSFSYRQNKYKQLRVFNWLHLYTISEFVVISKTTYIMSVSSSYWDRVWGD